MWTRWIKERAVKSYGYGTATRGESDASDERNDAWLIKLLMQEMFVFDKLSMLLTLVGSVIAVVCFWDALRGDIVFLGAVALLAARYWRAGLAKRLDMADEETDEVSILARKAQINALLLGSGWGLAVYYSMTLATPEQLLLSGIWGTSIIASGTLTYRTMPFSARNFTGACTIGIFAGLMTVGTLAAYGSILVLLAYILVLRSTIEVTVVNVSRRLRRERESKRAADTINMLLTDFTEQGSDCLIELDENGRVVSPSARFAEMAHRPMESLKGTRFLDMLIAGDEKSGLADHIENRRAFRNHAVKVIGGKDTCWWTLSARPLADGKGGYRGVLTDITAQRQAEKRVTHMAHFDALTDLPNRFQFQRCLANALQAENSQIALMFLDLDEFKSVNDTMGHTAGDILLKRVAQRLSGYVTDSDIVARLGGDEFAILLPYADRKSVNALCKKIIAGFAEPIALDGQETIVSTSIGIALAPVHGSEPTTLLRKADLALYEAKEAGRNRHTYFKLGMDVVAQNRRELEQDLRKALKRDELCLHYQPLVNANSGKTNGYEALIRWEHPARGVVMPDDFIGIAEESGLIIPVGEWVIRQALDDLSKWSEDTSVSINLSPAQMRSPTLISTLINALARTQVAADRVCLEITESVLMQDSDVNMRTLHKLRDLGLKIALDDFGTGYSSLNYLRSFPFDKIKIDRCFISEIESRDDCQAIVRSVVNLASSLGMTTTAEGVESQDQLELLKKEGCEEVQGYLYSKALPQEQLTDLRLPTLSHSQKLADLAQESEKRSKRKSSRKTAAANKKDTKAA